MLGTIIGDMVGSIYEFDPIKTKGFNIFDSNMFMTDDSYLTLAVTKVLINNYPIDYSDKQLEKIKHELIYAFANEVYKHSDAGWGGRFLHWAYLVKTSNITDPYNSYGNGSAMRISPVGYVANSLDEVKILSKAISEITHNHLEGLKGAEAIASCIYLARTNKTKEYIRDYIINNYYPEIKDFNYEQLVKTYRFNETCQGSCPQAIYCFLISNSFEDTIRNCIGIGGDCDTLGAMAGAIAEAYYWKDNIDDFSSKFISTMIDKNAIDIDKEFFNLYKR